MSAIEFRSLAPLLRAGSWPHSGGRLPLLILLIAATVPVRGEAAPLSFEQQRNKMVDEEVAGAGVKHPGVIDAVRSTPRHEFVPIAERPNAYYDMALPIGQGQTISPPFIVAYMTEQLDPQPTDKVLEIGTGSGYQAAVLSPLVESVYSIEIVPELGRRASATLRRLGYENVHTRIGDGYAGWPEAAPFDKIIVTCSPEKVPQALVDQLAEGGRMVIPLGERYQQSFYLLRKVNGQLEHEALRPTLFVPMTGEAERKREVQPDGSRPQVANGGFEVVREDPPSPEGWHYQRQLELVESLESPEGSHFIRFKNEEPGRGAQALQGFAIDGRKVRRLRVSTWVQPRGVLPGANRDELPAVIVYFYDDIRRTVGQGRLGPWRGTGNWEHYSIDMPVPGRTREAIIGVGLHGATGEVSFDGVTVEALGQ